MDERNLFLSRENAEIISKIEDGEDEVDEIIKKNKQLISEVKKPSKICYCLVLFALVIALFVGSSCILRCLQQCPCSSRLCPYVIASIQNLINIIFVDSLICISNKPGGLF